MRKVNDKSIGKKNIEILGILGVVIIVMCLLNAAGLSKIAGFNKQIGQCFSDYKIAYESGNVNEILEVEDQISYTMTHSYTRINGTLIFNIVLVALSIAIIISIYLALNKLIAKPIQSVNDKIKYVADGDLTIHFDIDESNNVESKNEVILMQKNMNEMVCKLKNIITNVTNVSDNIFTSMNVLNEGADAISKSTSDIALAIEEVSNGAVSTAEDTNNAMEIVSTIEQNVNGIKDGTDNLLLASKNMNDAKDNVVSILKEFVKINEAMSSNINETNNQINITNKNMKHIQKFIEIIKNIASETRLLSLNASIEASHAGTVGKGFAVVANKIEKLAEQSAKSAEEIEETLNNLFEDYDLIVQKMNIANENIVTQNIKLADTEDNFSILNTDINVTATKIEEINLMIDNLDKLQKGLVVIISSLSATSQENAAASEETNAAIEELVSTIEHMCNDIKSVKDETNVLLDSISVFNINES